MGSEPIQRDPLDGSSDHGQADPGQTGARETTPPRTGYARRVVGGTFFYGLGASLPQFVRFLLLPVFTRILSVADYGVIEMANSFGAFLQTPMRMGVPNAVTRFYFDYPEGPKLRDYITSVSWFVAICSLGVGILALWMFPLVGGLLPGLPLLPFAVLAIVGGILSSNQEMQNRLVQAREQAAYAARLNIGRAGLSIGLGLVFVLIFRWGAAGMLSADFVAFGVLALVAVSYLRPELKGRLRRPVIRSSLAYGIGLLPAESIGTLTPLVTRAILTGVRSTAATGLLSTGLKFMQPLNILVTAFNTAYNPIYFSLRKDNTPDGLQRLAVTARNVWALAVGAAVGGTLLGPPLVRLMLPETYHAAASLLPILVIGFLGTTAYNLIGGPEVYYSKQTWWLPVIVFSCAALDIVISALTAARYGAAGVALGMSARLVATAVWAGVISIRLVKIPFSWFSLVRISLCGIAAVAVGLRLAEPNIARSLVVGSGAVVIYIALLAASGDPSIRAAWELLRRRIAAR